VADVDALMLEIEDEVRRARRTRLLAQGAASDYQDPGLYAAVDALLRRAVDGRDHDALLLGELAASEGDADLQTHLQFSTHRRVLGPAILFVKRRVLLPMMRWLFEYSLENFRRQQRLNRIVFACLEELAIENARLRQDIAGLQDCRIAERAKAEGTIPDGTPAGGTRREGRRTE
jgi:Arc/MetJ family transcription regulator